jgi:hypothetical protein
MPAAAGRSPTLLQAKPASRRRRRTREGRGGGVARRGAEHGD